MSGRTYDPVLEALNEAFNLGEQSGLRHKPFDHKTIDEAIKEIKERYFM